ncbi:undecaprenyldiphospho-muramoylpentapeptide beta-N-acetylglucosaminyltransferase [Patescibacteria group bacterium]|nr:undecaprenyldiphospho-muramoylpentapeptide beta-N-acetylglucosaminyltransferase [Patescibacteria group bacterium]MBU2218888.1 undecaprenyldiphospho-muramoylpentapeptide beta-N-acetylglucosaminyltransferase [Patescibacteria group bacterium]
MRIIFTGGGTGGHFYPIVAVADALNGLIEKNKIIKAELIFMSDSPCDSSILLKLGIRFKKVQAGKLRRYFSLWNIVDAFKIPVGIMKALWTIYTNFPDAIFSKGGYASFPAVFAARIFGIPLIIHESDAVPGKVNQWSGKFAKRIAISFPQTAKYFPKEKAVLTGNPVRRGFFIPAKTGAKEFLKLEENIPTIFIIGGSQGSQKINDNIIDILPELLKKYQVIHQCGKKNIKEVEGRASIVLEKSPNKLRYHSFDFLNESSLRMAYGAADLVVARASSGSIFEIAASGVASILIPLPHAAQDHQRENAYTYAVTGAAQVIEEANLKPNILFFQIDRLLNNKNELKLISEAAKKFARPDAAEKIAKEIINLVLEHA